MYRKNFCEGNTSDKFEVGDIVYVATQGTEGNYEVVSSDGGNTKSIHNWIYGVGIGYIPCNAKKVGTVKETPRKLEDFIFLPIEVSGIDHSKTYGYHVKLTNTLKNKIS